MSRSWQICKDPCLPLAKSTLVTEDRACNLLPCSAVRKLWPWIHWQPAQQPQLTAPHEPIYIYIYVYSLTSVHTWWEWGNQGPLAQLCKIHVAVSRDPDWEERVLCLCARVLGEYPYSLFQEVGMKLEQQNTEAALKWILAVSPQGVAGVMNPIRPTVFPPTPHPSTTAHLTLQWDLIAGPPDSHFKTQQLQQKVKPPPVYLPCPCSPG